jgi:valyl-tRNA synthetase
MSKSKGNVVTPMALLEEHGSDAVRYWAAKGGPGVDTAFDPGQMKVGRRLAIKLLNASRFVLSKTAPGGAVTEPLDRAMLRRLAAVVASATRHLEAYDYAAALRDSEEFFWWFCDDYIELMKRRRAGDGDGATSAAAASGLALDALLRLFAPFLPFVTEEVWSWCREGSVHHAGWPVASALRDAGGPALQEPDATPVETSVASSVTASIRAERSAQKLGFSVPVRAAIALPAGFREVWSLVAGDVLAGNNVIDAEVSFEADEPAATIRPAIAEA